MTEHFFFTNIAHCVFMIWFFPKSNNLEPWFLQPSSVLPSECLHSHPSKFQNHIKFNAHLFWLHNVNKKKPFTRYCGRYKNKETAWNFTDSISGLGSSCDTIKRETSQITFHNPGPVGQVHQRTERNKKQTNLQPTPQSRPGGLN